MAARSTATRRAPAAPVSTCPRWRGPLVSELALATRAEPFSAAGWLFELKYDGWRLLAAKDGDTVTLRLRSGRDAASTFPEVAEAVSALPVRRALLDGEVVVFAADGRSDFDLVRARALTRRKMASGPLATACFFDLLALDDHDLRQLPLVERKALLRDVLPSQERLRYVDHVETRGEDLLAGARRLRLEGVVAKRLDSAYQPGRTGSWLKFKVEETADFVVVGIAEPSEGTFWRPGLVLAAVEHDALRYVGRVALGGPELDALRGVVPQLQRRSSSCPRAGRAETWLEPAVVAEVRYLASSGAGLRHAVFVRFRPDKHWRECDR
jgi:bifunctional non-homologous end joining protein LigD